MRHSACPMLLTPAASPRLPLPDCPARLAPPGSLFPLAAAHSPRPTRPAPTPAPAGLKVIRKKLVRKALDVIRRLSDAEGKAREAEEKEVEKLQGGCILF